MSIKKELLTRLSDEQLKDLAKSRGIKFNVNRTRKKYYADWNEREKIIDIMSDKDELTVTDIEEFIKHS